ncbi:related to chitin synthase [Serendipita indica DSM 11827]|uniref:Chitin synthase n=1 Tax=Serendipita indica (strain DSM 11827) TaxID=1109443 RepID=G4TDE8_SERID|nr:related to chitin synthase [Serendipita indica DSM 11827]
MSQQPVPPLPPGAGAAGAGVHYAPSPPRSRDQSPSRRDPFMDPSAGPNYPMGSLTAPNAGGGPGSNYGTAPSSPYHTPASQYGGSINQSLYAQNSQGYHQQPYSSHTGVSTSTVQLQDFGPVDHDSTTGHGRYQHDETDENQPLNAGANFTGGFYPPPNSAGMGMPSPTTTAASVNASWRNRQTIKRGKTKKVKLTRGNFITEYPVPTPVSNAIEAKWKGATTSTEFTHMRYSAATCDPDEYTRDNGWTFRQVLYNRPTELLIAVTSYNEDKTLYSRTLHGVMLNIRDICKTKQSKYWRKSQEEGIPGWQRITVALIVDGLKVMDKTVLDILATIGVYQDGIMKQQVDGKDTVAHIFEYTTQLSVDSTPQLVLPHGDDTNNLVPVQIILIIKAQNQKKINSHRWLFNAIGKQLQPEVCVLIDAGTKPGHKSIFHLWDAFYNDPNLGGACGEIHAMLKGGKKLLNPLVAAQNFEYKMSNILDKPLESSFGYVSVLPGAFSAYRYRAIQGRPLDQYFHGDHSMADRLGKKGIYGMNIFTKNMFLAEDRILCFELVAKANAQWTLTYVKPSKAETDVPESAAELIGQRRRWLNGSFAASVYALIHFFSIYKSSHGIVRMFFFHIQALYNLVNLIFSWFALANLWLTFSIIIDLPVTSHIYPFGNETVTAWANAIFRWTYLAVLGLNFIIALGNRPKGERFMYVSSLWVYGILAVYLFACSIILTVKSFSTIDFQNSNTAASRLQVLLTGTNGTLMAALMATFGIYLLSSLLYRDPWHMFTSLPAYICLAPSFTNVLNVYAFCNLHDVSWGTKGSDKDDGLTVVSSKKGKGDAPDTVEDVEKVQEDLDSAFQETVQRAMKKLEVKEEVEQPTMDDSNRAFRTRLVVVWMLTNAMLAVLVANINGPRPKGTSLEDIELQLRERQSFYFKVILWSTFGLSFVRFLGCLFYWFRRNIFRWFRRN